MPNWCYTQITINCDDKNKLEEFEKRINEWTSHNYIENGFGLNWLGNIVGNSGIGTTDTGEEIYLRCRGRLTYLDNTGDQLIIDTETAWEPMLKMWVKLLDKYLPEAELIYQAQECGFELYLTNDPYLFDRYIVDIFDPVEELEDIEGVDDYDQKQLKMMLQKLLDTNEEYIETLLAMFEESDFPDHMAIHKWDIVEPDNLD